MSPTRAEVEEQNREFLHMAEYYARSFDAGEYFIEGYIALAYCGVQNLTFNTAALIRPISSETEMAASIEIATRYFQQKEADWTFIVCDAYVPEALQRLVPGLFAEAGLEWFWGNTGMVCTALATPTRILPVLEYRPADDEETRNVLADINARAYGVDRHWFTEVILNPRIWTDRHRAYIGYVRGRPVVTAVIYRGETAVGLYWVATEPDAQGAGYAEAAMRYALGESRDLWGIPRVLLQATDRGVSLYERMGFRRIVRFEFYTDED